MIEEEVSASLNLLNLSDDDFHVGEMLLYLWEGHTAHARIETITFGADSVLRYRVNTLSGDEIDTPT